jgi:hypothetical protein
VAELVVVLAALLAAGGVLGVAYAVYLGWCAGVRAERLEGRASALEQRADVLERIEAGERLRNLEWAATTAKTAPTPAERPRRDTMLPPPAPRPIAAPSAVGPVSEPTRTREYVSPGRAATGERGLP